MLNEILAENKKMIENHLETLFPADVQKQKTVLDAMKYSVRAGGKRIRPTLFVETMKMLETDYSPYLDVACSLELIHTYSLIHDDLPAMDDDDLRRGKPTNHKVFGEAQAILAGDGLLNLAYEVLFGFLENHSASSDISACSEIAKAAGVLGMIGGQSVDIESENKSVDESTMEFIHRHKTGALIEVSMMSAAMIAKATKEEQHQIRAYARNLGLLFQITDDLLDVIGEEQRLGKRVHHDVESGKMTYPSLYGIEKAKDIAASVANSCVEDISGLDRETDFFVEFAMHILRRDQ